MFVIIIKVSTLNALTRIMFKIKAVLDASFDVWVGIYHSIDVFVCLQDYIFL